MIILERIFIICAILLPIMGVIILVIDHQIPGEYIPIEERETNYIINEEEIDISYRCKLHLSDQQRGLG